MKTRFAPSPTGLLHVGNAYSALCCQRWAEKHHAELLLRIEDIDHTRCRSEYADRIIEDLSWLGLQWQGEVRRQSARHTAYRAALARLETMGVLYPCFCTRKQIQQEIEQMGIAPHAEDHGAYPGICRIIDRHQGRVRQAHERFAWRLDIAAAMRCLPDPIYWQDGKGRSHAVAPSMLGDMVIGRKDIGFSYHLAVVVDDADQGITHVIRGEDLRSSTPIHRLLQALLDLPSPVYIHHPLLLDSRGERLAKRNHATTLQSLREAGLAPEILQTFLTRKDLRWPFTQDDAPKNIAAQLGSTP